MFTCEESKPVTRGTQKTQNIPIAFIQRRPNVFDVDQTLYKCYTNVFVFARQAVGNIITWLFF